MMILLDFDTKLIPVYYFDAAIVPQIKSIGVNMHNFVIQMQKIIYGR